MAGKYSEKLAFVIEVRKIDIMDTVNRYAQSHLTVIEKTKYFRDSRAVGAARILTKFWHPTDRSR